MQVKMLYSGNNGETAFAAGDVLTVSSSEWVRDALFHGLAEPYDDAARDYLANPRNKPANARPAYLALAKELGVTAVPLLS